MIDRTLRSSNMAMENGPLIDDFPGYKPPLIVDFPLPCWDVPSGNLYNIAIKNSQWYRVFPLKMMIFHGYITVNNRRVKMFLDPAQHDSQASTLSRIDARRWDATGSVAWWVCRWGVHMVKKREISSRNGESQGIMGKLLNNYQNISWYGH